MTSRLAFAVFALVSAAALAAPVKVDLRLAAASPQPVAVEVIARPLAAGVKNVQLAATAPGITTLDLAPHFDWSIAAAANGYWAAERLVERGSRVPLEIVLWPAGSLRGTIDEASPEPVKSITVRFRSVDAQGPPPGQSSCPVIERAWSCTLPAGMFDLRIRPDNAISAHRFDVRIDRHGADAGMIPVRRGASVSGALTTAPGLTADVRKAVVVLEPVFAAPPASEQEALRRAALASTTVPNRRGFFHFDGIPPGDYILRAALEESTEAKTTVRVLPDREAELVEPLMLDVRKALTLRLSPPVAPDGEPWRVELSRAGAGDHYEPVAGSAASAEGVWSREGLASGDYSVMILSSNQTRWALREVTIAGRSEEVDIRVPLLHVRGQLRIGSRPLRATIWFGGDRGPSAVPVISDEEGHFAGIVAAPSGKSWSAVTVTAEHPFVRRTLAGVEPRRVSESEATVDLTLPSGVIEGRVRDQSGADVEGAVVTLHMAHNETSGQLRTPQDGEFLFAGLAAGRYALRAESRGRESDWIEIDLSASRPATFELVVMPKQRLKGTVVSDHGPIPGAQIDAFPMEHRYPSWARQSDSEGRFEVNLPPWTRRVALAVGAPGHAFRLMQVIADPGSPLLVRLTQLGGRLICNVPSSADARNVWLVHGGAAVLAWFVPNMAGGGTEETANGKRLTAPLVEPGEYALCIASDAQLPSLLAGERPAATCAAGTLAPGGELVLTAPSLRP